MIALTFTPPKGERPRVLIRNCYAATGRRVVENMREWLGRHGPRYTRRNGVVMERLQALGFTVVRGPFMVAEPRPNCMAEISPKDFEDLWERHRDESVTAAAAAAVRTGETPTLRLIRAHWRVRKVKEGWTRERVLRLAALWKLTPYELAELIQWSHGHMQAVLNGSAMLVPGPVAIWFTFLENFKCGVNTFPDLPHLHHNGEAS